MNTCIYMCQKLVHEMRTCWRRSEHVSIHKKKERIKNITWQLAHPWGQICYVKSNRWAASCWFKLNAGFLSPFKAIYILLWTLCFFFLFSSTCHKRFAEWISDSQFRVTHYQMLFPFAEIFKCNSHFFLIRKLPNFGYAW